MAKNLLHKYVTIPTLKRILGGSIRMTQPGAFNDPFELLPEIIVRTDQAEERISFSFDMTRSSTGPATWIIEMSTNGGASFSTLNASYTAIVAGATGSGTSSWTASGAVQTAFNSSYNLGAAADNASEVIVRIRALVDPVNSSNVYQAGGTARIDNILVNGTLVPAPGAAALVGLAGLMARRRRG